MLVLNPLTGRYVKAAGKVGRRVANWVAKTRPPAGTATAGTAATGRGLSAAMPPPCVCGNGVGLVTECTQGCGSARELYLCTRCDIVGPDVGMACHGMNVHGDYDGEILTIDAETAVADDKVAVPVQRMLYLVVHNAEKDGTIRDIAQAQRLGVDLSDLRYTCTSRRMIYTVVRPRIAAALRAHEDRCKPDPHGPQSYDLLPTEIWARIVEHVPAMSDRWNLSQTCKRLHAVAVAYTPVEERLKFSVTRVRRLNPPGGNPDVMPVSRDWTSVLHDLGLADVHPRLTGWKALAQHLASTGTTLGALLENGPFRRRARLVEALQARGGGLKLRQDSRMCAAYIRTGKGCRGESLEEVVDIAEEMNFLHTRTAYLTNLKGLLAKRRENRWKHNYWGYNGDTDSDYYDSDYGDSSSSSSLSSSEEDSRDGDYHLAEKAKDLTAANMVKKWKREDRWPLSAAELEKYPRRFRARLVKQGHE
jgi:hypothetical protein